jgi:hypothetical protein
MDLRGGLSQARWSVYTRVMTEVEPIERPESLMSIMLVIWFGPVAVQRCPASPSTGPAERLCGFLGSVLCAA